MMVRASSQQLHGFVARQAVSEEEPQERLVARLHARLTAAQPGVERLPPLGRQGEHPARSRSRRLALPGDQPEPLEPAQLRIELAVARGPEETRRAVDDVLHLVPAHPPHAQQPEHDTGGRVCLHTIYLTDIC